MFTTYDRQQIEEALCVLYVALTRPIHALHIIVAPSKENEKSIPATAAGILRAALADQERAEPYATLYENGMPDWSRDLPPAEAAAPGTEPVPIFVRLKPREGAAGRGLETQSPSQLEGGLRIDLADRLRLDRSAAMDWGTAMHACFEQITWLDDGMPDDDLIRRKLQALQLPQTNVAAVVARFRRALQHPAVRTLLSRSAYAPDLKPQVWNERTFVVRREDTILRGTFDRLVVLFDGDTPVRADVIDFKSDSLDPNDPAAITEKKDLYRPQLEAYRSAVQQLYGLPTNQITTRLVLRRAGLDRTGLACTTPPSEFCGSLFDILRFLLPLRGLREEHMDILLPNELPSAKPKLPPTLSTDRANGTWQYRPRGAALGGRMHLGLSASPVGRVMSGVLRWLPIGATMAAGAN